MGKVPITVMGYLCERCGHQWVPRDPTQEPKVCPECKTPYWNKPKKQAAMTYEEFRDQVKGTLKSSGKPLTWTEVRTTAKLPQALPNNQWVHRMERDINLKRQRDEHGIIRWTLS